MFGFVLKACDKYPRREPKPEVDDQISEENSPAITGPRFCDMEVLSVFAQLRCRDCGNLSLLLMEDNLKRKGCASTLRLLCEHCGWKHSFCTSKKQGKSYEVNRRLVYGMRTIGKGYEEQENSVRPWRGTWGFTVLRYWAFFHAVFR